MLDEGIFPEWGRPVRIAINDAVDWMIVTFGNQLDAATYYLIRMLVNLEAALSAIPPIVLILILAGLAYAAGRNLLVAAGIAVALWVVGAFGMWERATDTIAIMAVSVALCILIGVPIGILMSRSALLRTVLGPILDLMQTIPSFVYLIPAVMLIGLGKVPAIIATIIYAVPPLIRLTDLGIRLVDKEVVEATRAFGASRMQQLLGVQIPLALPNIIAGINQAIMMSFAMVVIASMIGARGLGETVLEGLQRQDPGRGFIGGVSIVILAIVFDRILQAAGRRMQTHREVGH